MTTTTDSIAYAGSGYTAMTVTNLQSLVADSSDPFTSWQSDRIDNTSTKAIDYEFYIYLPTTNNAAANDKAAYVYVVPWLYDGSGWHCGANFSTTTDPTGSEGTASISDPNSMAVIPLPYVATQQKITGSFNLLSVLGWCPDGVSLAIRTNNCAVGAGQGLTTGCIVAYRAINFTNA